MRRILTSTTAMALLASTGNVAFAQDEAGEASRTSARDTIVVTAQKREQSVDDVPISIAAIAGDELEQLGVTDIADLARVVPGFVASNTYFGTPVYYLRGVGYLDTAIAARPAVSLYANEVPLPFAATTLGATLDLDRVEVLKGPQGTFFGSNATGGAVNFVGARPSEEFEAGADFSYGRFNEVVTNGHISGALTDGLNARLAVGYERMDDWQNSITSTRENGGKSVFKGRLSLDANPTDRLSLQLTLSGTIDKSDTIAPQLIAKNAIPQPQSAAFLAAPLADLNDARSADWSTEFGTGADLQRDDWTYQASLRADYEVSPEVTLTSITAFTEAGIDRGYDADGAAVNVTNLTVTGEVQSFFQEVRAGGEIGDRINYVVGGNYQKDESSELVTFFLPEGRNGIIFSPPIDLVPEIADQDNSTWAIFGNLEYDITDQLTVFGGLRYTETKTDFSGCAVAAGTLSYSNTVSAILGATPPAAGECATFAEVPPGSGMFEAVLATGELDEDNVSWRGGLSFTPTDGSLLYASVSRGYKAGSFSNISAAFASQYEPVPQEELTSYEIGAKVDVTPQLHVNAAAFYYDYKDKQLLGTVVVPVFGALTGLVSIPESHVQGAELEIDYQPMEGLLFKFSGLFVDTEVDGSYTGTTVFGASEEFGGTTFPDIPKWQLNGGVNYNWALTQTIDAFAGVHLNYRSETFSDFIDDPVLRVDNYLLVDAQIGVSLPNDKLRVAIWGRNLTDKVYSSSIVRRQEALVRTVGMPRMFGVRLSYDY